MTLIARCFIVRLTLILGGSITKVTINQDPAIIMYFSVPGLRTTCTCPDTHPKYQVYNMNIYNISFSNNFTKTTWTSYTNSQVVLGAT